jgi:hypothetical protein
MKVSSFWSSSGVHGPFFSPASFSQHGDRPITTGQQGPWIGAANGAVATSANALSTSVRVTRPVSLASGINRVEGALGGCWRTCRPSTGLTGRAQPAAPAALVDENLLGFPCAPSSIRHRPMLAAWPQPSGATRRAGRSPPPRSERPGGPSLFHTRARRVKRSCWRRAVRAHRARAPNDTSRQRKRTRTVRSRPTATAVGARFGAPPPPAASIPPTPRRGARTAGRHRIRGIGTGSDGRAAPYIHALKLFGPVATVHTTSPVVSWS